MYNSLLIVIAIFFGVFIITYIAIMLIENIEKSKTDFDSIEQKYSSEKVVQKYKKMLLKNPSDFAVKYRLASFWEKKGELDESRLLYTEILNFPRIDSNIDVNTLLSKIEEIGEKLNDREGAFRYLIYLLKNNPENKEYIKKMGLTLIKEGKAELAKTYLDKLIADTDDIDVMFALAYVYEKCKDYGHAALCVEHIYRILKNNPARKNEIEDLLLVLYIRSEELFQARKFSEYLLRDRHKESNKYLADRAYIFALYKLNEKGKFFEHLKKLETEYTTSIVTSKNIEIVLDCAFYFYFIGNIDKSFQYFTSLKDMPLPIKIDMNNAIGYITKMKEMDKAYKDIEKTIGKTKHKQKPMTNIYCDYISEEEKNDWDNTILYWENNFLPAKYINTFVSIKPSFDILKIMQDEGLPIEVPVISNTPNINRIYDIDKIYDIEMKDFISICQNIIKNKLRYFIEQEIILTQKQGELFIDGVDYIVHSQNSGRLDFTLIGFRRWKGNTLGELALRDFILSMREYGAKKCILFTPLELSKAAKSYTLNNEFLTVYSRLDFNNFLRDEKIHEKVKMSNSI